MLLYVCVFVSMCVLGVHGTPCLELTQSCPAGSSTNGLRPDECDVTKYYLGLWGQPTSQSCDTGKVYNQAACNCVLKPDCNIDGAPDRPTWMNDLSSAKQLVPLNALAIPGSHNSATGYINADSQLSPDGGAYLQMRELAIRWSKTQTLTFTQQLNKGIRYFDLRVAYKSTANKFYFVHDLYCVEVDTAMNEVKTFLDSNSHEVVLLDFNHFYEMTTTLHNSLRTALNTKFGSKLCPSRSMSTLTLSYMWSQSKQVVLFYPIPLPTGTKFWANTTMLAMWPNKETTSALLNYLYSKRAKPATIFQVYQGVLTPSSGTVIANVLTAVTLKEHLAIPTLNVFVPWLKNKMLSTTKPNIFMTDFVEKCNFIDSVIQLNN